MPTALFKTVWTELYLRIADSSWRGINPSGSFSMFSLNCFKSEIRFTSPSSACWASTSCSMSFTISSKPVFHSLFLLFLKHSYCCLSVGTTMSWLWLAYGVCHLDTAVCNLPTIFVILLVTARFKRWATTATRFRHSGCCISVSANSSRTTKAIASIIAISLIF